MLGLAITGGEGPVPDVCRLLAQNADLVIVADSGLEAAEKAGIRPDWIIGDMDSLDDPGRLEKYPVERVIRFPADKDFTDTELALELLWEKGCDEVCIAGGGGGRLDHLLAIRSLFERQKFPARWVTAFEDARCLDAGQELKLQRPVDTLVSVFPLGSGNVQAESTGLKWPLDGLSWDKGSFGISNRTVEESFTVRVTNGRFLLVVPLL